MFQVRAKLEMLMVRRGIHALVIARATLETSARATSSVESVDGGISKRENIIAVGGVVQGGVKTLATPGRVLIPAPATVGRAGCTTYEGRHDYHWAKARWDVGHVKVNTARLIVGR